MRNLSNTEKYDCTIFKNLRSYFLFCMIALTDSSKYSTEEKQIIAELSKNFAVNQCFAINQKPQKNFDLIKYLSKLKIQTGTVTANQTNFLFYQLEKIEVNKPRLLMILDVKFNEPLSVIFNDDNEYFLSKNVWVVFDLGKEIFKGVYIPYNCEFLNVKKSNEKNYEIFEVYTVRLRIEDVTVLFYGTWTKDNGLEVSTIDFFTRRMDLKGTTMKTYVNVAEPNTCEEDEFCCEDQDCLYQFITFAVADTMNFRIQFVFVNWVDGVIDNNGTYFFEISLGPYAFHFESYDKDVVGPLWKSPVFLHIAYDKIYVEGAVSAHARPFNPALWIAIIAWILTSGICISIISYLIFNLKLDKNFILLDSLFLPLESFTNQCGGNVSGIPALRISFIMTLLAPMLILAAYSAEILSFVTVKFINLPFQDIEEFVKDGTYKIGYEKDTFPGEAFKNSKDPILLKVSEKYLVASEDLPWNDNYANERLCEDHKFAWLDYNNDLYAALPPCRILQISKPVFITWDVFILRNNSPYREPFNKIVTILRSTGTIDRMETLIYWHKPSKEAESDFLSVGLESLHFLYKVVASVYLISLLILMLELLYANWNKESKGLH